MSTRHSTTVSLTAVVVGDDTSPLSLAELSRACRVPPQEIAAWVDEGIVEPAGGPPGEWLFNAAGLQRALTAARLKRDLGVAADDLGLVLDLLDEIGRLQARLHRAGLA